MKKLYRVAIWLLIMSLYVQSFVYSNELTHMCAYSNKSVVRFRDVMLKKAASKNVSNPGVVLDWPIDLCQFWISSLYGPRKDSSGKKKMHNGIDMAAFKGTKVKAAGDGVIKSVEKDVPGYGNLVEIEHATGSFISRYAHLDKIQTKVGEKVQKGDIIGTVGATGNVRGADPSHLHLELVKDGQRVDPLHYLYWAEIGYRKNKK